MKNLRTLSFIALSSLVIACATTASPDAVPSNSQDTFALAQRAYDQGRYQDALDTFLPLAELGDADAQLMVGTIYDIHQPSLDRDVSGKLAFDWYLKAAEQGNTTAQWLIAVFLDAGVDVQQDYAAAAIWYRRAAEKGDAEAQYGLGDLYFYGRGVEQDSSEAFRWMLKSATGGNAMAQFQVAGSYECGDGVAANPSEAGFWYEKAAAQGDAAALTRLHQLSSLVSDDFCD